MIAAASGALVTGLLGPLHCAGMCGPLALAVGGAGRERTGPRLVAFVGGKALTYVLLGATAGLIGAGFGATGPGEQARAVVAFLAGLAMVVLGLASGRGGGEPSVGAGPGAVGTLLSRVLGRPGAGTPVVAGMLAGLLPCALVHAMLAQAVAVGSLAGGALVMLAFGLGTAPSVLAAGWLGRRVGLRGRALGERLAVAAVIVMGLVAMGRGLGALVPGAAGPACH